MTRKPGSQLVDCQKILYEIFHISPFKFELRDTRGPILFQAKAPRRDTLNILIYHNKRLVGRINREGVFQPEDTNRPAKVFSRWYRRMTNPMFPFTFKEKT